MDFSVFSLGVALLLPMGITRLLLMGTPVLYGAPGWRVSPGSRIIVRDCGPIPDGHNPPLHLPDSYGPITEPAAPGRARRVIGDAGYEPQDVHPGPGDILIPYPDGITEAGNAQQEMSVLPLHQEVNRASRHPAAPGMSGAILDAIRKITRVYLQSDAIPPTIVWSM